MRKSDFLRFAFPHILFWLFQCYFPHFDGMSHNFESNLISSEKMLYMENQMTK